MLLTAATLFTALEAADDAAGRLETDTGVVWTGCDITGGKMPAVDTAEASGVVIGRDIAALTNGRADSGGGKALPLTLAIRAD